mmetsp:Transcript_9087/g.16956  ORF Transcript_9087/g.16956 Transcript_9087/m.16956 type:complete len:278 (+) Transcript_9087:118-951(+)
MGLTRCYLRICKLWLSGGLLLFVAVKGGAFAPTAIQEYMNPSCYSAHHHQSNRRTGHLSKPQDCGAPFTAVYAMEERAVRQTAVQPNVVQLSRNVQVPALVYALNSSTKWIVTLAHTLAVWCRPWAYTGPYIVVGSIIAVYLTEILKKLINQSRPSGSPMMDPGMPSSHSLVSFFAAVAWTSVLDADTWVFGRMVLIASAAMIAALRVLCGYHSLAQVVVGAGIGSILGRGWVSMGKTLHVGSPRLVLALAWGCYLGGSAVFIHKNMRHWAGRDSHH